MPPSPQPCRSASAKPPASTPRVKFDFGEDGLLYLDGTSEPYAVSNEDAEADCTVAMSLEDFKEMATGALDPTTAFMMGKLKVTGDMGVAMKLAAVLGERRRSQYDLDGYTALRGDSSRLIRAFTRWAPGAAANQALASRNPSRSLPLTASR